MIGQILRQINRLPCRLTLRHYYPFGNCTASLAGRALDSPESWDILRLNHPHFSIPQTRAQWIRCCETGVGKDGLDGRLVERAYEIIDLVAERDFQAVISVGVGAAALEYHLKRLQPRLELICSEYAPGNVRILQSVFPECDAIVAFDMLTPDWPRSWLGNDRHLCLMNRVDPHFTDEQWRTIFANMHRAGVRNVLYIPSTFLTIRNLLREKRRYLACKLRGQPISFAGYIRTRTAFRDLWAPHYGIEKSLTLGGLESYLLRRM